MTEFDVPSDEAAHTVAVSVPGTPSARRSSAGAAVRHAAPAGVDGPPEFVRVAGDRPGRLRSGPHRPPRGGGGTAGDVRHEVSSKLTAVSTDAATSSPGG